MEGKGVRIGEVVLVNLTQHEINLFAKEGGEMDGRLDDGYDLVEVLELLEQLYLVGDRMSIRLWLQLKASPFRAGRRSGLRGCL